MEKIIYFKIYNYNVEDRYKILGGVNIMVVDIVVFFCWSLWEFWFGYYMWGIFIIGWLGVV